MTDQVLKLRDKILERRPNNWFGIKTIDKTVDVNVFVDGEQKFTMVKVVQLVGRSSSNVSSEDETVKRYQWVGFSKRNPMDKPNPELGFKIALHRALTSLPTVT